MKIAECLLESISPYSQSRYYEPVKKDRETSAAVEERTWRERCNADSDGRIFIPPMAFANNIKQAASYLGLSVPGKGQTKYAKFFESGVLVPEALTLPVLKAEVEGEWLMVPSDGKVGGGKRVKKCFPLIRQWGGRVIYYILDDIITETVFRQTIDYAGNIIGIGRFRPTRRGYYGRFKVQSVEWIEG